MSYSEGKVTVDARIVSIGGPIVVAGALAYFGWLGISVSGLKEKVGNMDGQFQQMQMSRDAMQVTNDSQDAAWRQQMYRDLDSLTDRVKQLERRHDK